MNYKEFTAYKNSILSEVKVNEDGSTENDNHFRYTVSYLDAENISRSNDLIAKTMTEAVYRSCWMYMALFMPDKSTVDANPEESLEKLKKLSRILFVINLLTAATNIISKIQFLMFICF